MRPTTAKKGPPRKKIEENQFDQIKVEDNNLPAGIILDEDQNIHEDEKNNSFDNNIMEHKQKINIDNLDVNQHGKLVRDIINEEEGNRHDRDIEDKDSKPKIKLGRIGGKQKSKVEKKEINSINNEVSNIKIENIENIDSLRKAIQNICQ